MTSRGTRYWSSGTIPLIGPELLGNIIATASDISVVVSEAGQVLSVMVNPEHEAAGHLESWIGRDMRELLTLDSVPKLTRRLESFATGSGDGRAVELNHAETPYLHFPVRYHMHRIGPDGAILMLGRDMRPVAEMQQQLVEAQIALERDYENQRETGTRMRALMETSRDAVIFVAVPSGRIVELNGGAARLLGATVEDLNGADLTREVSMEDGSDPIEALLRAAREDGGEIAQVTARRNRRTIVAHTTAFRAAGERMLLCRFERGGGEAAGQALVSQRLGRLFERGADGIVFTDRSGRLLSMNDAFLGLVDLDGTASARGRALSEFLARESVDYKVLADNAVRNGQMKLYATRLRTDFGSETAVEISATYLPDPAHPALAFVIRDVSRSEAVRGAALGTNEDDQRPVRELVGTTTLKDIVSETTEVVEKICIETAVELTGNNRVAAAEMLGLSRQSLYVKLRKYGLLARHGDGDGD